MPHVSIDIKIGKVIEVQKDGILVYLQNIKKQGFCAWEDLTDFPQNKERLSELNKKHKFLKLNKLAPDNKIPLGYKQIHPEELFDKRKIIPTANHFSNLQQFVYKKINFDFSLGAKDDLQFVESFSGLLFPK